jgi:WD40 repeat protein
VGTPVNVTDRSGYDNQPFFTVDGRSFYYTSAREGQTDIYRYDFASASARQLTDTPESEYSPTPMPDGQHFSVVRVERDSTQRLWAFTVKGVAVKPVLDTIKPVGYHAWLNADTVYVFVLGQPATLRLAEPTRGTATIVASDVGRSIFRIPGRHAVSYVQRDSTGGMIRSLDPGTGAVRDLTRLPAGAEFYAWTPDGDILSASGNQLLRWRSGQPSWEVVAQFSEPGLQKISRLAVSPMGDRIALVADEPSPPQ